MCLGSVCAAKSGFSEREEGLVKGRRSSIFPMLAIGLDGVLLPFPSLPLPDGLAVP